ncbi:sensor histidine kinase [Lysobacter arvi]|uniref:histidine kinase n=1 Tax=Lysobacter arvi TaxID=3038776 RepID=A0ABU1CFE3_9GAMM|nr:ATP-binding protein [Lysobacter arvi]MDR0183664.1 ATP-binding protein [Lysobacter arvi]
MSRPLRSTSTRLALAVMGTFLLAFVLLGAGLHVAVSTLLLQDARELVRTDAAGLLQLEREGGRAALVQELRERLDAPEDPDAVYALVAADGRAEIGDVPAMQAASGTRWATFDLAGKTARGDAQSRRVLAQLQPLPGGGTLVTGLRLQSQDRFLALMLRTALVALAVAATLGALAGWLTSRWVSRRLGHLDRTAARVGGGELGLRVPLDGSGDAFDRLGRRFNAMLDRIEELLGGVRHATDHIAHDLRTPLTRLRNRLEDLRHRSGTTPAERAALDGAVQETDHLLTTFGALLRLARIEAQAAASEGPEFDLSALVADAVELYTPIGAERSVRLVPALTPARVRGDRDQLFQMLVNLLDNALKYAPEGSEVGVSLRGDAAAVLCVDDQGPGIPEGDRERVFDRFQRLEAHRGTPGSGLGLSLVRAIVHRHGGRIELLDRAPGLRVRVVLPRADTTGRIARAEPLE